MATVLEDLSTQQEAQLDQVADEYIADLVKPTAPDMEIIRRWLAVAYGLYEQAVPARIEIAASPDAALALASELTGENHTTLDDCGVGDGGWVSFYDFWHRAGILSDDEAADVLVLRDFARVAWDMVLLDECAIIVRRPLELHIDEAGALHSANGPCIRWADGVEEYAWHGTWVPKRTIVEPHSYSREEFLAIANTEERRALAEAAGWQWVCDLLGAVAVDTWIDPETTLAYALLRCSDGTQLLQKQSPRLKNGSQPTYVEPVHENLRAARSARKWQATRLSPEECERDPDLRYLTEA